MTNQKILAITDDERDYAIHLMEYLMSDTRMTMRIAVYTGADRLLSLTTPEVVSILVIAESEYTPEVAAAGYEKVLVLNETDRYLKGVHATSKYQPMDGIADEILHLLTSDEAESTPSVRHGGRLVRIGFCSPIPGCLQTSAALCLANLLSQKAPALVLNFEPLSGLSVLLSREFTGDLSELVYYSDCQKEKLSSHLSSILVKAGAADLVPPLQQVKDLSEIRADQWLELLSALGEVTDYGYVVLDLTQMVQGLFEILDTCDLVVVMTKDGRPARAKLAEFNARLTRAGQENLLPKIRQVQVPDGQIEDPLSASSELSRLLSGEILPCLAEGGHG